MPLVPLIVAARNARELVQLARRALEHYRTLPHEEQQRLRGEASRVKSLSAELAASHAQSARERVAGSPDKKAGRDPKVVARDLREALTQFSHSASQEAAVLAKGRSRKMRYAAKAVGFGARRLQRDSGPQPPAAAETEAEEHQPPASTPARAMEHASCRDCSEHLADSNIDGYTRDESMRVLEVMLREQQIAPEDIRGISRANMSLLLVHRGGVVFGAERGVVKKRVEIGPTHPMSEFATITSEQPGLNGSAITVSDARARNVFTATWGTGGPISRSDAAAERTRIFRVIAAAMDHASPDATTSP